MEGWNSRLVGQVHDSLNIDALPEEVEHIEQTMKRIVREDLPATWSWIIVPLDIDIEVYPIDSPWVHE